MLLKERAAHFFALFPSFKYFLEYVYSVIIIELLLCFINSSRFWEYSSKQNRLNSFSHGTDIVAGGGKQTVKEQENVVW